MYYNSYVIKHFRSFRGFICFLCPLSVGTWCRRQRALLFISTQRRSGTRLGKTSGFSCFVDIRLPQAYLMTSSDLVVSSNPPLRPVLVRGERAVILHEERAVGARQPDWRDGG